MGRRSAFTKCGVAKIGPSEDSFCRICRPIAQLWDKKDGVREVRRSQKWTAAADLQPTFPKSDTLLDGRCGGKTGDKTMETEEQNRFMTQVGKGTSPLVHELVLVYEP